MWRSLVVALSVSSVGCVGAVAVGPDGQDSGSELDDAGTRGPDAGAIDAGDPRSGNDGGQLPSFVPPPGERANINLNSAEDVDYDRMVGGTTATRWWTGYGGGNSFASMVSSYSGSVWAPQYGNVGAIVLNGGGHGGFIGAFVYLFDFETRQWKQVGAPRNLPPNLEWAGYAAPPTGPRTEALERRDPDWMDFDFNGSFIKFSDHTYLQNAYVAPSEGGGPRGSLLLPQATFSQDPGVADPRTGIAYRWAPHLFSLETGVMTRAAAAPFGMWGAYSNTAAVKDTAHARLWYPRTSQSTWLFHDLHAGPPFTVQSHLVQKRSGGTSSGPGVYNSSWLYVPEAEAIVGFSPAINGGYPSQYDMPVVVQVFSVKTGVPVDLERADIPQHVFHHGGLFVGAAWSPTLRKFYLYEGLGEPSCWVLTPSSLDFATATFSWSKEAFSGAPPITRLVGPEDIGNAQSMAPQGKFVWVPAYESFAWHDGPSTTGLVDGVTRTGIVQLWRPPGHVVIE